MGKKYCEFMEEITSDEVYEGLLAYGLFNERLPPFLTAKNFFEYCQSGNRSFMTAKKEQSYIYYESMRNINTPRPLAIPNPIAYQSLCWFLRNHWQELQLHFKNKTQNESHKISRIHIRKMKGKKSLFEMNYSHFKSDGNPELDLLIGKNIW